MEKVTEVEELNEIFSDVKDFVSENEELTTEDIEFLANSFAFNEYMSNDDYYNANFVLSKMINKEENNI